MKKIILIVLLFLYTDSFALNIRLYGRSGVEITDGKTKVCPGLTLNCCAVVHISWSDVWDFIRGDAISMPGSVEVFEPPTTFNAEIYSNNPSLLENVTEETEYIDVSSDDDLDIVPE